MWPKKAQLLLEKLTILYPVIQAPMAVVATTTALVSSVANAGGLGSIAAAYLTPEDMRTEIRNLRKQTNKPFNVNLFIPQRIKDIEGEEKKSQKMMLFLADYLKKIGYSPSFSNLNVKTANERQEKLFQEKVTVLLEEQVPVVSFAFGLIPPSVVSALKAKNTIILGTATTVKEGILLAEQGCDMIVAQGSEAGGHRGTFQAEDYRTSLIGTLSLVPQMVSFLPDVPVIAAGGIMDGRGLVSALDLGAAAVQMGTAFLTCDESGIHPLYKKAILDSKDDSTVITSVFSGKPARGIRNKFIDDLEKSGQDIPAFLLQNELTRGMRKEAAKHHNIDYMSLWAGQGTRLNKAIPAKQLIENIITEAREILQRNMAANHKNKETA